MTIDYLPWNRPAALADRVCVRDTNVELTYAEAARRVDAIAEQFAAAGVGRGDVVAVMLPNRVELLLGLMAAWRLGAAAMKLGPDDNCLLVLPLFHVNAILASCLAPVMAGGQVTILARFHPETFLGAIARYRATCFSAPRRSSRCSAGTTRSCRRPWSGCRTTSTARCRWPM
jgi:acyl-CoA synthetase (AMP-forming)/AMP-acid ligase II